MRKKRVIVASLSLVLLAGLIALFHEPLNQFRTLMTFRQVDEYPLYVMTYYGDYGFKDFLQKGIQTANRARSYDQEMATRWACTCFSSLNKEGDLVFGRNFDWYVRDPVLILFADPPDGYASVSMVDISFFGYDSKEPSWADRTDLLRTPLLPLDGMNERGLAVGIMAVPHAEGGKDPEKVTIGSLHVVRLILDYAQDVDEAISLLGNYNVDFRGGLPLHYLVSDSSGNSAVVEFTDDQMSVLQKSGSWQVAANFVISETMPEGPDSSCWRYNKVYEALEQTEGIISRAEAMVLLEGVSHARTIWSTVYDMVTGDIDVAMGRKYGQVHEFRLAMTDK